MTTTTMKAITISPTQTPFLRHTHLHHPSLLSFSKPPKLPTVGCNSSPTSSNNLKIPQQQQHKQVFIKDNDDVSFDKFEEEVQVGNPRNGLPATRLSLSSSDQAFFLLTFIACTVTASFVGFVMAAVPTLLAMSRTAIAFAKLADTAREELPSTMAAIRLSGMEISDLTLELSDLSHEISDGVNKSAQAVQAAEAGVRQIGSLARHKTLSMIEERANLPEISTQTVVAGVAKKTSQAVGHAGRTFMNMMSGSDSSLVDETTHPT